MPPAKKPAPGKKTFMGNQAFAFIVLAFAVLAALELRPKETPDSDEGLARYFEGFQASFVIMDLGSGKSVHFEPERAKRRLPPMSTFKIANAIIALDAGVIEGPDSRIKWDGRQWPYRAWNQDQTLATAIAGSAVWAFQDLARQVGPERMNAYVKVLGYGNADIKGGIDRFWLDSSLLISADEQVDFLRRLVKGELPVSARSLRLTRDMLKLEQRDQVALYGKTGARLVENKATLGWFVGWLERPGKTHVFAANLEAADGADGAKARAAVEAILGDRKLW